MPSIFFCTDIVKPYSVIIWFNLYAAFCKLSSVSAIMTWSSTNSSVDSCRFFESLIPVMSWFCNLVIYYYYYYYYYYHWLLKNKRPTRCHLLFYFTSYVLKHASDINISIIRSLRLFCWITTLVVLVEFGCGWVGVVSTGRVWVWLGWSGIPSNPTTPKL